MIRLDPRRCRPLVVAHRGASREAPENTRAAFDRALAAGAAAIELDLQLSRDGVPVVWHDRTLRKAGRPRVRVSSLALAALRRLDAGGWFDPAFRGERVLTLEEVLARYADRATLFLEIKAREYDRRRGHHLALMERVLERLRARRRTGDVILLSYDEACLALARATLPRIRTVLNLDRAPRLTPIARARFAPLAALSLDVRRLEPGFSRRARALGQAVLTFTVNRRRDLERALAAGVQAIFTDRPAWALAALRGETGRP